MNLTEGGSRQLIKNTAGSRFSIANKMESIPVNEVEKNLKEGVLIPRKN